MNENLTEESTIQSPAQYGDLNFSWIAMYVSLNFLEFIASLKVIWEGHLENSFDQNLVC